MAHRKVNIMNISYPDLENGLGCRVTLWIAGCPHHCKNCHNPETWDFKAGEEFEIGCEAYKELIEILGKPYIKGITLSGGDPLGCENSVLFLQEFLPHIKELFPEKDVWLYTGWTLDEIRKDALKSQILDYVDYLVDGRFNEALKGVGMAFRGSFNQVIWEKRNGEFVKSDLN